MNMIRLGATKSRWLLAFLFLMTASPAYALLIQLDLDAGNAAAGVTEPGFTRLPVPGISGNANGTFIASATESGVTVSATQVVGSSRGFRDRGVSSPTVPPPPYQHVLRDFIYSEGTDGSEIGVTIQNLPAGMYDISTFSHDWNVAANADFYDIRVTDALGTNVLKVDNADFNNAGTDTGQMFSVLSDGINDIIIRIIEDSSTNRTRFNGIIISDEAYVIPEPATATLGLLAFGGLMRRRRRGA